MAHAQMHCNHRTATCIPSTPTAAAATSYYYNVFLFSLPSTFDKPRSLRTMWWCIFATPAMRLAPPIMQLRQADALSAGTGLAAGRAAPMMAVEQQGHSAAFQCHACCPGCLGCLGCSTHLRGGISATVSASPKAHATAYGHPGRTSEFHRQRCRHRRRDGDVRQRDGGHVGQEPRQATASLSGAVALLDEGHVEAHPRAQERGEADQGGGMGTAALTLTLTLTLSLSLSLTSTLTLMHLPRRLNCLWPSRCATSCCASGLR